MPRSTRKPDVPGLAVRRHYCGQGWEIIHEPSGATLGLWLRLRRQAEAAMSDFGGTGEDFTLTRDELQKSQKFREIGTVLKDWRDRQRHCCRDGEHYSVHSYAMEGRCTGDNGAPRRS